MKKMLSTLLAIVLVLSCCTVALAAGGGAGIRVETLCTKADGVTVGIYAGETLKNSRIVLTYPDSLTLTAAESKLPEEAGITDLDTSAKGTVSFAWAAYEAQKDALLLELSFQGANDTTASLTISLPETGETLTAQVAIPFRFDDVRDETKWYFAPVYQVYDQGLMNGVGGNLFAPNKTLNRATVATVLYRLAGSPEVKGSSPFTDVAKGSWYEKAVAWASEKGIALGYGNGIFAPGKAVSRQEMAAMIYRFWKTQGDDTSADLADLSGYRDGGQVAGWAKEAMCWAVGNGIIHGMGKGELAPKGTATRAQVAQILVNYQALA